MGTTRTVACVACLGFAILIPLMGVWSRQGRPPGCSLDGVAIQSLYQVWVLDHRGTRHAFCSLACAELWLLHQAHKPQTITVVDEITGAAISADQAYFVRSLVVTQKGGTNRIHVFQELREAENHARLCHGVLLVGKDRPFGNFLGEKPLRKESFNLEL